MVVFAVQSLLIYPMRHLMDRAVVAQCSGHGMRCEAIWNQVCMRIPDIHLYNSTFLRNNTPLESTLL
jgi:hypothetical protein